ncbi:SprT-like domain-containing protein [Polyangium sp. y55x31]|uniref:SprT-like domain-containing protein n=1 Tax=Polyangium sp. y55x31 TaxID=3042688 RepID=UPI002482ECCD|nr:SprT-like domain-containing protein [Polyangium sp. y55x31]MDI1483590.1 SprT-like domain-containing protein [Polyangium sp. y55x31]
MRRGAAEGVPRIDPRTPARALAALVEQEGQEAPKAVYRAFEEYNRAHFDGRLGQSMLLITQPASPRTLGDYVPRDAHGIPSRIRIAPKCETICLAYVLDVVLHEMVHAWQHEVLDNLEQGYEGHGPRFAEKCNEIGAKFGLAEVAPKGRRGKAKAAHWPMCVRPEGFYGPNDPRKQCADEEEQDAAGRAKPEAGSAIEMTSVLVEGLDRWDLAFFRVVAGAKGLPVADVLRELAIGEARRMAQTGSTPVGAALAAYGKLRAAAAGKEDT